LAACTCKQLPLINNPRRKDAQLMKPALPKRFLLQWQSVMALALRSLRRIITPILFSNPTRFFYMKLSTDELYYRCVMRVQTLFETVPTRTQCPLSNHRTGCRRDSCFCASTCMIQKKKRTNALTKRNHWVCGVSRARMAGD
jgi:hypothetical protein